MTTKPYRTITDHVVSSLSPVLIMLLVGSLVFFLIQVFGHGNAVMSLRWVMFWFVLGIVLLTRVGIEEGASRAVALGAMLALVTVFYMVRTDAAYLLGFVLLGVVWWCAHKLTWNCTYVDDEDDATGQGLMETLPDFLRRKNKAKAGPARTAAEKTAERHARLGSHFIKAAQSQTPGLWVIYFSAAAVPIFGIGQTLIPAGDTVSRRLGFLFMVVYLAAALGLFLTTSFLGLRRYLRQRYVRMPRAVAVGWMRFGVVMILVILGLALLLPRPGANYTWKTLAVQVDAQLRRASNLAVKYNPHGQGQGRAGDEAGGQQGSAKEEDKAAQPHPTPGAGAHPGEANPTAPTPTPSPVAQAIGPAATGLLKLLRVLFVAVAGLLFVWWLVRNYVTILQALSALWEEIKAFFARLSETARPKKFVAKTASAEELDKVHPFASYQNPFTTGADRSWAPERVVTYTYEAVQAWARGRGIEFSPEQTPREFCAYLGEKHPEMSLELGRLTVYYAHAAYGTHLPATYDVELVRQIWRIISN
jgi:hypothetical protein